MSQKFESHSQRPIVCTICACPITENADCVHAHVNIYVIFDLMNFSYFKPTSIYFNPLLIFILIIDFIRANQYTILNSPVCVFSSGEEGWIMHFLHYCVQSVTLPFLCNGNLF